VIRIRILQPASFGNNVALLCDHFLTTLIVQYPLAYIVRRVFYRIVLSKAGILPHFRLNLCAQKLLSEGIKVDLQQLSNNCKSRQDE